MPIVTRTEGELLESSKKALRNTTTITNNSAGSTAGALLEIAATEHASIHRQLEVLERDLFLSTATGASLDRIGDLLGTTRSQATRAFDGGRNVRIRIDGTTGETASSIVVNRIPTGNLVSSNANEAETVSTTGFFLREGITLTANNGATYLTTEGVTFANDDVEKFVPVIATGTGPTFNVSTGALTTHNISTLQPELNSITSFLLVDNRMPITSGELSESDDSYRFRIQNAIFRVQSSNQSAIISAAVSVPGVRNATFVPYTRGGATFTVVVESTDPIVSDGILSAVRQSVTSVTAAGNRGLVDRPVYKTIRAKVGLTFRPEADRPRIRQLARLAATNYINSIPLGETFILNELIQRIMDIDELILDTQIMNFSVGDYEPSSHILRNESFRPPSNMALSSSLHHWYTSDRFFTVCDAPATPALPV